MNQARAGALCLIWLAVGGGGVACRARPHRPAAPAQAAGPAIPPSSSATTTPEEPPARPLRRCFPDQPAWSEAMVSDLLDRAGMLFDSDDFTGALACAEEAARQAPRSVESHHDRAAALI